MPETTATERATERALEYAERFGEHGARLHAVEQQLATMSLELRSNTQTLDKIDLRLQSGAQQQSDPMATHRIADALEKLITLQASAAAMHPVSTAQTIVDALGPMMRNKPTSQGVPTWMVAILIIAVGILVWTARGGLSHLGVN